MTFTLQIPSALPTEERLAENIRRMLAGYPQPQKHHRDAGEVVVYVVSVSVEVEAK